MLDIDPLTRISIEDVVRHPWLRSHQAHDLTIPLHTWESPEDRDAFAVEMQTRTLDLVDRNERVHVFPVIASFAEAVALIMPCMRANGADYAAHVQPESSSTPNQPRRRSSVSLPVSPAGDVVTGGRGAQLGTIYITAQRKRIHGAHRAAIERWHTEQFGAAQAAIGECATVFAIEVSFDTWRVYWERGSHVCATLGEWHSFTHSIADALAAASFNG